MYKKNPNFIRLEREYSKDYVPTKYVTIYPEHQLSPVFCVGASTKKVDCLCLTSDLFDLLNQNRLESFGADVVRDYVSRMMPHNSSASDAISKMSDDEIMESIKPRNIQSYSEIQQWANYVGALIDSRMPSGDAPTEPAPDIPPHPGDDDFSE